MFGKLKKIPVFLKEVKEELKKVNWSSRQELIGAAIIVIITSAVLTAYIAVIDLSLAKLVQLLLG